MKKLTSVLLSVASALCVSLAFSGCGDNNDDLGNRDEETIVNGYLYNFVQAYEMGLIDCYALESIACSYYNCRNFENNPYADKYISTEELSDETEYKIKRAYSEKHSQSDDMEKIKILYYYGTYDNNAVVTLSYGDEEIEFIGKDYSVYGVLFPDYSHDISIWVFYVPEETHDIAVSGNLYKIDKAYENGLLDEKNLKSISCRCYENFEELENPYGGLYQRPIKGLEYETKLELRRAFEEQSYGQSSKFEEIKIYNYYGTYSGNIVVAMSGSGCYFPDGSDKDIGGVTFCKNSSDYIYVYQLN